MPLRQLGEVLGVQVGYQQGVVVMSGTPLPEKVSGPVAEATEEPVEEAKRPIIFEKGWRIAGGGSGNWGYTHEELGAYIGIDYVLRDQETTNKNWMDNLPVYLEDKLIEKKEVVIAGQTLVCVRNATEVDGQSMEFIYLYRLSNEGDVEEYAIYSLNEKWTGKSAQERESIFLTFMEDYLETYK